MSYRTATILLILLTLCGCADQTSRGPSSKQSPRPRASVGKQERAEAIFIFTEQQWTDQITQKVFDLKHDCGSGSNRHAESLPEYFPVKYITCTMKMTAFNPAEFWSECNEYGWDHFRSPVATFIVEEPAQYRGAVVRIRFMYSPRPPIYSKLAASIGMAFTASIPEDYFTGKFSTIDPETVAPLERLEINRRSTGNSSSVAPNP